MSYIIYANHHILGQNCSYKIKQITFVTWYDTVLFQLNTVVYSLFLSIYAEVEIQVAGVDAVTSDVILNKCKITYIGWEALMMFFYFQ